jgi:hypothetical protein
MIAPTSEAIELATLADLEHVEDAELGELEPVT